MKNIFYIILLATQIILAQNGFEKGNALYQKEKYTEAMKEYQHKKFSGRFMADSFLLIKRLKEEKKYTVVKRFEFACLPVSNGQGSLFSQG